MMLSEPATPASEPNRSDSQGDTVDAEQTGAAQATVPSTSSPDEHASKAFWLTVGNGALSMMGSAFFATDTVLAGLTEKLTKSSLCVGALVSASSVGWMWPQIFVGHWLETKPRKMPAYILSAVGRVASLILMAVAAYFWRGSSMSLYWILFLSVALFSSFGGIVGIPFMDIVAKTIHRRHLPLLWAYRNVFGGILGFVSSGIIAYILSARSNIPFPRNYALLFSFAIVLNGSAYAMFAVIREPIEPVMTSRTPFRVYLKRGIMIFKHDRDYRLLYLYRCVWAGATMSQAILVPCAVHYFDAPPAKTGGWFTGVILLVGGISSLAWGWLTRRVGEVRVLHATGTLVVCPTLIALLMTLLMHVGGTPATFLRTHYMGVYIIIYALASAVNNGNTIAYNVYTLSLPPPELRPSYLAFINTLIVPLLLAPTLAGYLVELLPYPAVFALSCICALATMRVAAHLQPRTATQYPIRGDSNGVLVLTSE
ncbi:MAG TPA: MFS transporter [Candidatus Hydrogenedentes bacterium]|nr:MFS transporter [Candidatus Hydrogenedentota bacterium]HOL76684.1 MFS transporter [Candidatus Hydrogenedentota bacterium]HPO85355.1 MFS transporter [Candidatus Hydrogenedentota bacterium]